MASIINSAVHQSPYITLQLVSPRLTLPAPVFHPSRGWNPLTPEGSREKRLQGWNPSSPRGSTEKSSRGGRPVTSTLSTCGIGILRTREMKLKERRGISRHGREEDWDRDFREWIRDRERLRLKQKRRTSRAAEIDARRKTFRQMR